jgi:hypothetical protein
MPPDGFRYNVRMSERHDIDFVLQEWPYQPGTISARIVQAEDGRDVLQMRVEMGVLQMEIAGRPDGQKTHGHDTFLEWITAQSVAEGEAFVFTEEQCIEIDREFLQFYHRRICFLALREFARAVADADHTLALMEFVATHSADPQWTASHQQYRAFVLFHRIQAATMVQLQDKGAEAAIEEINQGLVQLREAFAAMEAEEQFDEDEMAKHLVELKESLREEYHVGRTLAEQLAEAVASEEYERAARLRDEIAKREGPH